MASLEAWPVRIELSEAELATAADMRTDSPMTIAVALSEYGDVWPDEHVTTARRVIRREHRRREELLDAPEWS